MMPVTVQVPLRELTFINQNGVAAGGTVSISGHCGRSPADRFRRFEDVRASRTFRRIARRD